MAVSLKNGKSKCIGLIVCDVANYFFSQVIDGVDSIAYSNGYHLIITQSHDNYQREIENLNHLAKRHIDGLLVAVASSTFDYNHFSQLIDRRIPMVFFDRDNPLKGVPSMTIKTYQSSFNATEYLIKKGYKKIGFLGHAEHLSTTRERRQAYLDALKKYNLTPDSSLIKYFNYGNSTAKDLEGLIANLFLSKNKPDAVFVSSDRLNNACLLFLKKNQESINIMLSGFNNSDMAELFLPSFSFIRQPAFELGQDITKKLINLISRNEKFNENIFKKLESTFHC
ncbi:hypothetical protein ADIARSV_0441 [Arcticibacter svalbardensis MN12-7]|uniref:Periplasmic binding protein/LacI sugar binding domain-containing protein n=1 Tax=Arcticibacter svalbardensis MN12-7 TaxID=1150600 RepID=R9GXY3_9SPHI|nr:substrate-binding domain-containing protein [Arcticibacter svalbardensis]EOR96370.1 hypothetical protein ADIARSV_0441 [Arcticibacter svalbardensis MN12-7]